METLVLVAAFLPIRSGVGLGREREEPQRVADSSDDLQHDGTTGGLAVRNERGPVITDDALVWGVFYTSGFYDATGNGIFYGSMIAKQGIGAVSPTAGTPDHYWDQSLRTSWPPVNWTLPRTVITRWETDR